MYSILTTSFYLGTVSKVNKNQWPQLFFYEGVDRNPSISEVSGVAGEWKDLNICWILQTGKGRGTSLSTSIVAKTFEGTQKKSYETARPSGKRGFTGIRMGYQCRAFPVGGNDSQVERLIVNVFNLAYTLKKGFFRRVNGSTWNLSLSEYD